MQSNQRMDLKQKSLLGISWMSLSTLSGLLINVLSLSVLARLLTPSEHGVVAAVLVLVSFANIFGTLGAGPALIYRKKLTKDDIWTAGTLSLILSLLIYLVIFLSAQSLESFFKVEDFSNVAKVLGIIFIINSFCVVPEAILQKELKFKYLSIFRLSTNSLLYNVIAIIMALLDLGYWSLVYANIFSSLAYVLLICSVFYKNYDYKYRLGITPSSMRNLFGYGIGMSFSNLVSNFALQGDNLVVTKTLGEAAVGVYSRSYQLITYPVNVVGKIFDQVFFPILSSVREDKERVIDIYYRITKVYAVVSILISNIIIICAEDIVNIFLGAKWHEAIFPIVVFGCSFFFRLTYKVGDLICKSHGAVYNRAIRTLVYAILVVLGSIIGSNWGIGYVAVGVSIAIFVNYILMTGISLKLIGEKWSRYLVRLLPLVVIYAITYTSTSLVYNCLDQMNSFLKLILSMISVTSIFLLLTLTVFRKVFRYEYIMVYRFLLKAFSRAR